MRCLAKPLVWLGIILFLLLLTVITALSFLEFVELLEKNDHQIVADFKFVADAQYYRNLPITWLVIGIISGVLLLIAVLIFLFLFKRLNIALTILQEASKAVSYNFLSLLWPFIPFLLHVGVFVYWVAVAVYLTTAGKPIYRVATNETIQLAGRNITNGDRCNPKNWTNLPGKDAACAFWEYGYDPQVDLDSIIKGKMNLMVLDYAPFSMYLYQVVVYILNRLLRLLMKINGFHKL